MREICVGSLSFVRVDPFEGTIDRLIGWFTVGSLMFWQKEMCFFPWHFCVDEVQWLVGVSFCSYAEAWRIVWLNWISLNRNKKCAWNTLFCPCFARYQRTYYSICWSIDWLVDYLLFSTANCIILVLHVQVSGNRTGLDNPTIVIIEAEGDRDNEEDLQLRHESGEDDVHHSLLRQSHLQSPAPTAAVDGTNESLWDVSVRGLRDSAIQFYVGSTYTLRSAVSTVSFFNTLYAKGYAPICRFCHQAGTIKDKLETPCRCEGSLRFVHHVCLVNWLDLQMRNTGMQGFNQAINRRLALSIVDHSIQQSLESSSRLFHQSAFSPFLFSFGEENGSKY